MLYAGIHRFACLFAHLLLFCLSTPLHALLERGALIMRDTPCLVKLLERQHQMKKLCAAIGAAPAQLLASLAPLPSATCFQSTRPRKLLGDDDKSSVHKCALRSRDLQ
jgi:putative intracellular protease/amidase